jgi:hypothetical protein
MSEIKEKKWILNYVLMLIDEVKKVARVERDKVDFRLKMTNKHKTFSDKFPSLLMLIIDNGDTFDLKQLDVMLNLLENVQSGKRNIDDVDKELGKEYFDKYVAPVVDVNKS